MHLGRAKYVQLMISLLCCVVYMNIDKDTILYIFLILRACLCKCMCKLSLEWKAQREMNEPLSLISTTYHMLDVIKALCF